MSAEGSDTCFTTEPNNAISPMPASSPHPLGAQFHPRLPIPTVPAVCVEEGVSMDMPSNLMAAELAPGESEDFSPFPPTLDDIDSMGEIPTQAASEGGRAVMIMPTCFVTSMDERAPGDEEEPAERAPGDEEEPAERAPGDEEEPAELAPGDEEEPAELGPGDEEEPAERAPGDEEPAERAPGDEEPVEFATQSTSENDQVTMITQTCSMTLSNDVHHDDRFPYAIPVTSA